MDTTRSTKKQLKMQFDLENGKSYTLTLLNPKNNLSLNEVQEVATAMIGKEAIIVGGAVIDSLQDGYIITTTIDELADA